MRVLPMLELLSPQEMAAVDRRAIADGPFDGHRLMLNAGAAVSEVTLERFADAPAFDVLCGPGNNGGDGYVVARLLAERGLSVRVWAPAPPRAESDAARAAADCPLAPRPLGEFVPSDEALVVDALFGAGLSKPPDGIFAEAIARTRQAKAPVVAVDLPSGVSGDTGRVLGEAVRAELTVTFVRRKPGHLLLPGRSHCGETLLCDIGIGAAAVAAAGPRCFENAPALWRRSLPVPGVEAHKYRRGHAAVFSGGPGATGAARLAAQGAARAGAGAVTVLSPGSAMLVNAAHLTAIMLARIDTVDDFTAFAGERRPSAFVLGPGFGTGGAARDFALACLEGLAHGLVLDADGITAFAGAPDSLFAAAQAEGGPALVLTPHGGEFARLFPDLAGEAAASKLAATRMAAERAGGVIVNKGADTVIADPDGRAAINANGVPWLATAGSGDVLSGMIGGLAAQGMPAFEAACAAVWLHGEAARAFGPGLTADDLPGLLPGALAPLVTGR